MQIEIFTIFPAALECYLSESLIGRARRQSKVTILVHDLRDFAGDPRRSVDDAPFGGGAGMVLAPEPVFAAVEAIDPVRPLFLMSPSGERFDQAFAERLAGRRAAGGASQDAHGGEHREGFSLLCGRYEGVDERIAEHLTDGSLSVGDYVLAGGEVAALVVVEAVCRLLPGVLGNPESIEEESFATGLLEYPQFTRPADFRGWKVPEVLLSGDHAAVAEWRRAASLARTMERRPDLIEARGGLSEEDLALLARHGYPAPS